jgi:Fic family protein
LPNPDLFVAMYVRREAVLSSQIEGTQSSLDDVLQFEAHPTSTDVPQDVEDVVNYVRAMNYGLDRVRHLPLSLRLIREIHALLLQDGRGSEKQPGEFRISQNWIGSPGAGIQQAIFVPPPPLALPETLSAFEKFLHDDNLPTLVHAGRAHAQFETIHPFLDGNGRIGRLLITFLLCHRSVLHKPLLYLSHYLKFHRAEYYDRLMAIRTTGDWEGWLRFFLTGVAQTSSEAMETGRAILQLREEHRQRVGGERLGNAFLDLLYDTPYTSVASACKRLGIPYPSSNNLVKRFVELGILREITGQQRNRLFRYDQYIDLFADTDSDLSGLDDQERSLSGQAELSP